MIRLALFSLIAFGAFSCSTNMEEYRLGSVLSTSEGDVPKSSFKMQNGAVGAHAPAHDLAVHPFQAIWVLAVTSAIPCRI